MIMSEGQTGFDIDSASIIMASQAVQEYKEQKEEVEEIKN